MLLGKERDACEPTEFPDFDEHLQAEHPHLIMQPQTKKMPTPPWKEAAKDAAASSWEKKSWKKDDSWKGYEKKDWKKKDQWSLPVKKTAPPQHIVDRRRLEQQCLGSGLLAFDPGQEVKRPKKEDLVEGADGDPQSRRALVGGSAGQGHEAASLDAGPC